MNFLQRLRRSLSVSAPKDEDTVLPSSSETFCMAPWVQLHAQTHGEITPCCVSAYKGENVGDLRKNSNLAAAWNSAEMKQLRLKMLNGEKSAMCENCYLHEALGKQSDRMQYNRDYTAYYNRVKATLPDGTVQEKSIPVLDIRFSNKCNYKCRICNSNNSSMLYEEEVKLGITGAGKAQEVKAAGDEDIFWKSYEELLPGVKRLHFAGGEPLFMDEHYRVLEHLIAIGKTDVTLTYNTNLSTLRYKKYNIIDLWKKFERVDVTASLDGMGERGDYQRKGQRWNTIEDNIRLLQTNCPNLVFGVAVTVSILNVFHIPQFYKYMVENNLAAPDRINLYYLNDPDYFNVINLPPHLKTQVEELYRLFTNDWLKKLPASYKIKGDMDGLIKYMMSAQLNKREEFKRRITETDELRKESFASVFPELEEMMM